MGEFNIFGAISQAEKHLFVEYHLAWIINWSLKVIDIELGIHNRILIVCIIFAHGLLLVGSHNHFVTEGVHVALCQWDWLSQDIETGSNQVYIENFVILDHTEDSLIVVSSLGRFEINDYSDGGHRLNYSLGHRE